VHARGGLHFDQHLCVHDRPVLAQFDTVLVAQVLVLLLEELDVEVCFVGDEFSREFGVEVELGDHLLVLVEHILVGTHEGHILELVEFQQALGETLALPVESVILLQVDEKSVEQRESAVT